MPALADVDVGVHVHQFPNNAKFFIDFLHKWSGVDNVTYYCDDPMWPKTGMVSLAGEASMEPLDCLISLSQCAGIDTSIPVGTFLAPSLFVPFSPGQSDKEDGSLVHDLYFAHNDRAQDLKDIRSANEKDRPWSDIVLSHWNTPDNLKGAIEHVSDNPAKKGDKKEVQFLGIINTDDVLLGNLALLQTTGIWNPTPSKSQDFVSCLDVVHY